MVTIILQGGLCNQMYMAAFLYTYAKTHNLEYFLPRTVENPHLKGAGAYYFPKLNYDDKKIDRVTPEAGFHFQEFEKIDNTKFLGYFQSEKYFDEKEIQQLFDLPWKADDEVCGIHVRRGDYLKWHEFHPPVTMDYISLAMEFMLCFFDIKKFKCYSDDIAWCKENIRCKSGEYDVTYSEETNELKDLSSLSNHKHIIGSNSAFSLWGHHLNRSEDKFAIFPENWFGPKLPHDTKDLYPSKSISL